VIRALVSLLVVCLVAATDVRPVSARTQLSTLSTPRKAEKLHVRPVYAAAPRRTASDAPALPAIAIVCALTLVPPAARPIGPLVRPLVAGTHALSTRSARGPPVS
jgi:hypothetical protein